MVDVPFSHYTKIVVQTLRAGGPFALAAISKYNEGAGFSPYRGNIQVARFGCRAGFRSLLPMKAQ